MADNNQITLNETIRKLNDGKLSKIFESNSKLLSVMADLNGKYVYCGKFANLYPQYIYAIKRKNAWSFYLDKEELKTCTVMGTKIFADRENVDLYIQECEKAIKVYQKVCENLSNLSQPYEFLHLNVVVLYFNAYSKLLAQYRLTNVEYVNGLSTVENCEEIIRILAVNRINIRKEFMKGNTVFSDYALKAMGQTYSKHDICELTVDDMMSYYSSNFNMSSRFINVCCADGVSVKTYTSDDQGLELSSNTDEFRNITRVTGIPASCTDLIQGRVMVVNDNINAELLKKERKEPIIIVTRALHFDCDGFINNIAGIICDEGGILSHAAIIARENKIACIASTKFATKALKNGDMIEMDSQNGIITVLKRNQQ